MAVAEFQFWRRFTMTGDPENEAILVYTTFPDAEMAGEVAGVLVAERRVACANILPEMRSIYRWEGKVEQAREAVMILKSVAAEVDGLVARIAALHPYDVPAIVVLPVAGGGTPYLEWIAAETGSTAR
jgi:periplasmic divalent cation tolerance protein